MFRACHDCLIGCVLVAFLCYVVRSPAMSSSRAGGEPSPAGAVGEDTRARGGETVAAEADLAGREPQVEGPQQAHPRVPVGALDVG